VTTASYDRILRTYDIETTSLIRTFSGHSLAALCVAYDPVGTLIASGAKDRQVRLWDAVGGVCINTMSGCLGEVTSVEFDAAGRYLLVGSKDNANRLWDLRMVCRFFAPSVYFMDSASSIKGGLSIQPA
jgi:COMPASS component SWD3